MKKMNDVELKDSMDRFEHKMDIIFYLVLFSTVSSLIIALSFLITYLSGGAQ